MDIKREVIYKLQINKISKSQIYAYLFDQNDSYSGLVSIALLIEVFQKYYVKISNLLVLLFHSRVMTPLNYHAILLNLLYFQKLLTIFSLLKPLAILKKGFWNSLGTIRFWNIKSNFNWRKKSLLFSKITRINLHFISKLHLKIFSNSF